MFYQEQREKRKGNRQLVSMYYRTEGNVLQARGRHRAHIQNYRTSQERLPCKCIVKLKQSHVIKGTRVQTDLMHKTEKKSTDTQSYINTDKINKAFVYLGSSTALNAHTQMTEIRQGTP